jgi:hypothetical protein
MSPFEFLILLQHIERWHERWTYLSAALHHDPQVTPTVAGECIASANKDLTWLTDQLPDDPPCIEENEQMCWIGDDNDEPHQAATSTATDGLPERR